MNSSPLIELRCFTDVKKGEIIRLPQLIDRNIHGVQICFMVLAIDITGGYILSSHLEEEENGVTNHRSLFHWYYISSTKYPAIYNGICHVLHFS